MSGNEIRTIRQLVLEAREDVPPAPDWERLERDLLDRVSLQDQRGTATPFRWGRLVGFAAAAAVLATGGVGAFRWVDDRREGDVAAQGVASAASEVIDGDRLAVGRRIVAGTSAVIVEHAGRASWTLQPHSSASLVGTGVTLTVELEFGTVVSSVVPSEVPESFAVQVGGTRIAVHGTVFTVERRGDHAHVDVSQGTVAVGAVVGGDRAWLLSAPATGRFSLTGKRLDTLEIEPSTPRAASIARRAAAAAPSVSAAGAAADAASPSASSPVADIAAERAADIARRCFVEHTSIPGRLSVSASSTMTVAFAPSGQLELIKFDPPLAPGVHRCVERASGALKIERTEHGATSTRLIHLG
jgi:hypothetical protein